MKKLFFVLLISSVLLSGCGVSPISEKEEAVIEDAIPEVEDFISDDEASDVEEGISDNVVADIDESVSDDEVSDVEVVVSDNNVSCNIINIEDNDQSIFSNQQIIDMAESLGVPKDTLVTVKICEPYYNEGTDTYLSDVSFTGDDNYYGGADFDIETGEMVRDIFVFDKLN